MSFDKTVSDGRSTGKLRPSWNSRQFNTSLALSELIQTSKRTTYVHHKETSFFLAVYCKGRTHENGWLSSMCPEGTPNEARTASIFISYRTTEFCVHRYIGTTTKNAVVYPVRGYYDWQLFNAHLGDFHKERYADASCNNITRQWDSTEWHSKRYIDVNHPPACPPVPYSTLPF